MFHRRVGVAASLCIAVAAWLVVGDAAFAAHVQLRVRSDRGVPGATLQVEGDGFGVTEAVDLFFDERDLALVVTNSAGLLPSTRIEIPPDATPGVHWVTALGRRSGTVGRVRVRVAGTDDWLGPAYDGARTSWNPNERAITRATVGDLSLAWDRQLAEYGWVWGIVTRDETAFVLAYGQPAENAWRQGVERLVAIDTTNGRIRWSRAIDDGSARLAGVHDGVLVVAFEEGWRARDDATTLQVWGIDPRDGSTEWVRDLTTPGESGLADVIAGDGVAYVSTYHPAASGGNRLSAVRMRDGALLWQQEFHRWMGQTAVGGDRLVVAMGSHVLALQASTGEELWRLPVNEGAYRVAVFRGMVLFDAPTGHFDWPRELMAVRLSDGTTLWTREWSLWLNTSAMGGGLIHAVGTEMEGSSGEVLTLVPRTGEPVWKARGAIGSGVAGVRGVVFTSGACQVEARDARTGERLWFEDGIGGPIAVVNGRLLATSCDFQDRALVAIAPPVPVAPRARALVPDPAFQPDVEVEPAAELAEGWLPATFDGLSATDVEVVGTAEFDGELFVGTRNATGGGGLFATSDGIAFERVGTPGLGDADHQALVPVEAGGRLYVVTANPVDGLAVFESGDGRAFELVADRGFGDPDNVAATAYEVRGELVLGVENARTGGQLWTTTPDPAIPFARALGLPPIGAFAPGAVTFDGATYVGASVGADGTPDAAGATGILLRTVDGSGWEQVDVASGGMLVRPQLVFGETMYAVAASPDGLQVLRTRDGTRFEPVTEPGLGAEQDANVDGQIVEHDGRLVLATSSLDPRRAAEEAPIEVAPERGFELWTSMDGRAWTQVDDAGFGDPHAVAATPLVAGEDLFLAVDNFEEGDALLRSGDAVGWDPAFREASSSHGSLGLTVVLFDRHLVLVHGDELGGIDGWRTRDPVLGEPAGSVWWIWAAIAIVVVAAAARLAMRRRRGRHGPEGGLRTRQFEVPGSTPRGVPASARFHRDPLGEPSR